MQQEQYAFSLENKDVESSVLTACETKHEY